MSGHGAGWQEVGDRVFRFRYRSMDLNGGAVLGEDEVLVVDTRSWVAEAEELLADLRALAPPTVVPSRSRRGPGLSASAACLAGAAAPGTARPG